MRTVFSNIPAGKDKPRPRCRSFGKDKMRQLKRKKIQQKPIFSLGKFGELILQIPDIFVFKAIAGKEFCVTDIAKNIDKNTRNFGLLIGNGDS
jgi:hypothetical protein